MPKGTAQTGMTLNHNSKEIFKSIVQRLRANEEAKAELKNEMKELTGDAKLIYQEAKGMGFDRLVIDEVIGLLKMKENGTLGDHMERQDKLKLYLEMLGDDELLEDAVSN